jgi:CBS domain-containing protein
MRVQDVMSSPLFTIAPSESTEAAREQMELRRIHHLAVADGKRIVGVVSNHDLGRDGATVSEVMTADPVTATPRTTVREAANLLRGHTIGCLPVVDDDGKPVGIITVSDVLELVGRGVEKTAGASPRKTVKDRPPRKRRRMTG